MKELLLRLYVQMDCGLKRMVSRFHQDRKGAGVAEYAMIIGIVVVIMVPLLVKFSQTLRIIFIQTLNVILEALGMEPIPIPESQ